MQFVLGVIGIILIYLLGNLLYSDPKHKEIIQEPRQLDFMRKDQIVEEISDELKGLTKAQVDHLGPPGYGILSSVFYEFSDQSDYLHSLIIGTAAGAHLKAMIDHNNSRR